MGCLQSYLSGLLEKEGETPPVNQPAGTKYISRRQAWGSVVGKERADKLIEASKQHRLTYPHRFKGIVSETSPDYKFPVGYNLGKYKENVGGLYSSGFPAQLDRRGQVIPGNSPGINIRDEVSKAQKRMLALHETTHDLRPGLNSSSVRAATKDLTGAKTTAELQAARDRWRPVFKREPRLLPSQELAHKHLTSRTYTYNETSDASKEEYITELVEMRAGLERLGVDTTNPKGVYQFLNNASSDKLSTSINNVYTDTLRRALDLIKEMPPELRQNVIKTISIDLPGIAKTTTRGSKFVS